jgi:hypothetical protein
LLPTALSREKTLDPHQSQLDGFEVSFFGWTSSPNGIQQNRNQTDPDGTPPVGVFFCLCDFTHGFIVTALTIPLGDGVSA